MKTTRDVALIKQPWEPGFCYYRSLPRTECRCPLIQGFRAVVGKGHSGDSFGSSCAAFRRPSLSQLAEECRAQAGCACLGFDSQGCLKTNATLDSDTEVDDCFYVRTTLDPSLGCAVPLPDAGR
jgi:hypothetical protein